MPQLSQVRFCSQSFS